jgi:hypothetical protein
VGSVKKRGRPVGSKNKPKVVKVNQAQVNVAKKLGVSVEQFAKERAALERKPRGKAKAVDWEKLCKHLQTALRDEFADNEKLVTKVKEMEFKVANLEHQAIGYRAVVSYLENKLGNDTV